MSPPVAEAYGFPPPKTRHRARGAGTAPGDLGRASQPASRGFSSFDLTLALELWGWVTDRVPAQGCLGRGRTPVSGPPYLVHFRVFRRLLSSGYFSRRTRVCEFSLRPPPPVPLPGGKERLRRELCLSLQRPQRCRAAGHRGGKSTLILDSPSASRSFQRRASETDDAAVIAVRPLWRVSVPAARVGV